MSLKRTANDCDGNYETYKMTTPKKSKPYESIVNAIFESSSSSPSGSKYPTVNINNKTNNELSNKTSNEISNKTSNEISNKPMHTILNINDPIDQIDFINTIDPEHTKYMVNGWDNNIEQLMKKWNEHAQAYSWMHKFAAQKYSKKNNRVGLAGIFFTVSTAFFQTLYTVYDYKLLLIIVTILSYLAAILTNIIKFMQYDIASKGHKKDSLKYQELARNIEYELNLPRSDREDGVTYVRYVRDKMTLLNKESTNISRKISDKLKEYMNENYPDYSIPPIANGFEKIKINTEYFPHVLIDKNEPNILDAEVIDDPKEIRSEPKLADSYSDAQNTL